MRFRLSPLHTLISLLMIAILGPVGLAIGQDPVQSNTPVVSTGPADKSSEILTPAAASTTVWLEYRSSYIVGQSLQIAPGSCLNLDVLHELSSGASFEVIVQGEHDNLGLDK